MSNPLRLVVASHNLGKTAELAGLLGGLPVDVQSLATYPQVLLPEETGADFAENATLKAEAVSRALGVWALADDSGLVVPALDGAPGLHSARVAPTDPERIAWLLGRLAGLPPEQRGAYFVCVLALTRPDGSLAGTWQGRAAGEILEAPRGANGFGYDPVFYSPAAGRTFAELTAADKSALSHRGRALRAFREDFPRLLAEAEAGA
ncbi:MAG TPA: RdgB/HAM1 family non-canonical purine NTP pyrophosphatase [Armatimonadota bacterium]|jgi:XTP/dITP diphosphohydrolase